MYKTIQQLIDDWLWSDSNVETWGIDEIKKFHQDALWVTFCQLKYNNSYYQTALKNLNYEHPEQLKIEDLPFLTKEQLRKNPWMLLSVDKKRISQFHVSTGTTGGDPIYIAYSFNDLYKYDIAPRYRIFNVPREDVAVIALPYEMSSAGLAFHRVLQFAVGCPVLPVGKGGHYSFPDKTLRMMHDLGATMMITTPSYAVLLSEIAENSGIPLNDYLKLRELWITGEGASDALRERIEKIWKCPVRTYYGSLECGVIGIECEKKQGYHIAVGSTYLEIIDPDTGHPLDPGEIGDVVVTTLLREAMPMLRFKTEDIGYIDDTPCSCGLNSHRLFLRGRKGDQISIEGKDYSPFYIEDLLLRIPEVGNWYQLAPYDNYLEIITELDSGIKASPDLAETIASKVEYGTGIQCKVKFTDKLPRSLGKTIRVIKKGES